MTISKKDIIAVIVFLLMIIVYTLGLYQSSTNYYGNIAFSKPFGYRFHSAQLDVETTKKHVVMDYLGLYTKFKKSDETVLFIYQNLYTFSETIVIINLYDHQQLHNYKESKNCIYTIMPQESTSDKIWVQAQLLDSNTTFSIRGDDEDIMKNFLYSICKNDIL